MSKAVLISIRPDWCKKILRREKTVEVRKTRPKLELRSRFISTARKPLKDGYGLLLFKVCSEWMGWLLVNSSATR